MNTLDTLAEAIKKANEAMAKCNEALTALLHDMEPEADEELTEKEYEQQEADAHLHV